MVSLNAAKFPRSLLQLVAPGGIFHLIYFVTAQCNAQCKMCFYQEEIGNSLRNLSKELTLDEIKSVFTNLGFTPYISLTGGEPFLRKDILEIADHIASTNSPLTINIATNSSMPEKVVSTYDHLCSRHKGVLFEVQQSLDGIGGDHDEIRNVKGLFEKVIKTNSGLARLKERHANLLIKINITYSVHNESKIPALLDFIANSMKFDRIILAKAHGRCEETVKDIDLAWFKSMINHVSRINAKNQSNSLLNKIAMGIKREKESVREAIEADKNLGRYCRAGKKIAILNEQGNAFPCEVIPFKLGNVRDNGYDFKKTLSAGMNRFLMKHPSETCHCDWGCGQNMAVMSRLKSWPEVILKSLTS